MTSAWPSDQQATDGQASHSDLQLVAEPMVLYAGALLAGIGTYFVLPVQPNWWHVLAPLAGAFILWWSNRSGAFGPAVGLLVWLAVGLIVAHVHTMRMSTPLLYAGQMPWVTVEGTIKSIDYRDDGERLIVKNLKVVEGARMRWLDGSGLQLKPQHQNQAFSVGQRVGGRVQLFPIGPPPVPGSLDLQFRAYFDGVSAYGATRGPLTVLDDTSASDFRAYVEALRQRIRANIVQTLGEERGSVLVAMTVGFPRAVPEEKREVLRRAGLAHLLAISGLHMTLVVSGVFWLLRTVLAMAQVHQRAELWRLPIKKVSMLAALAVGLGYFFLSGQAVPAQRAFLMASLFAIAILLDRHGVSVRMLGVAAIVVMIVAPQVVLGPSFQMSFAAVTLLIFVGRVLPRRRLVGLEWQIPNYLLGVGFASVLATVATATLTLLSFWPSEYGQRVRQPPRCSHRGICCYAQRLARNLVDAIRPRWTCAHAGGLWFGRHSGCSVSCCCDANERDRSCVLAACCAPFVCGDPDSNGWPERVVEGDRYCSSDLHGHIHYYPSPRRFDRNA